MPLYLRPTKQLAVLSLAVLLFAICSVTIIALSIGQELGVRAVQYKQDVEASK